MPKKEMQKKTLILSIHFEVCNLMRKQSFFFTKHETKKQNNNKKKYYEFFFKALQFTLKHFKNCIFRLNMKKREYEEGERRGKKRPPLWNSATTEKCSNVIIHTVVESTECT